MTEKKFSGISLKPNERRALEELKSRLEKTLPGCEIVLFGSRVRGEGGPYSDIDILIIVDLPVDASVRGKIADIAYPLELEFDVVFGKIIENRDNWNTPLSRSMPLHWNIDREGVRI